MSQTKRTIFVLFVFTVLVGSVQFFRDNTHQPTSPPATTTPPLTLEYLQGQPEWNPTEELGGIRRIEDGGLSISQKFDGIIKFGLSNEYQIVFPRPKFSIQQCKDPKPDRSCIIGSYHDFSQFQIQLSNTSVPVHSYKLEKGYSFLIGNIRYSGEETWSLYDCSEDTSIAIAVRNWNNQNYIDSIVHYCINPRTGKITEL